MLTLPLTEGRSTGIPTIQEELRRNGSALATIETDEDRTFFLMDIPCHPQAVGDLETEVVTDKGNKVLSIEDLRRDLDLTWTLLGLTMQKPDIEITPEGDVEFARSKSSQLSTQLSTHWKQILQFALTAKSRKVILEELGLKSLTNNAARHIQPLIDANLLRPTSEKKNSSKQSYVTSEIGKLILKILS